MIKAWSLYFDVRLLLFIAVQTSNLFPHVIDDTLMLERLWANCFRFCQSCGNLEQRFITRSQHQQSKVHQVRFKFTRMCPVISARNKFLLSKRLPETLSGWSFRNFLAELRQGYVQHKYVCIHSTSFHIIRRILSGTDGLSPPTLTGLQFVDS